jgi:hypothetical protein
LVEKRYSRNSSPPPRRVAPSKTDDRLFGLGTKMIVADGKNPYFRGELAIRNIAELDQNIASFEHHEAPWVADWLEYLGDAETARKIRAEPAHFKKFVHDRAAELGNIYK